MFMDKCDAGEAWIHVKTLLKTAIKITNYVVVRIYYLVRFKVHHIIDLFRVPTHPAKSNIQKDKR